MAVTAAHLRELTALGVAGEALIRVAEIIDEVSADCPRTSKDKSADVRGGPLESTAEKYRKERDKQRKKAKRAAERAARTSADASKDNPVLSADSATNATVVLSSFLTVLPEEPLKKAKAERMRARGTRMDPGTPLSDEHRALIIAEGVPDPEKFWAEFVDYWSEVPGQRGVKIGWTGTLRNRCRDVIKRGFNRSFQGPNHGRRTVHDAANDLDRHIQSLQEPAPDGLCGGTGQGPLRLISPR